MLTDKTLPPSRLFVPSGEEAGRDFKMGLSDFTYAHLFDPSRLERLHALFLEEVSKEDAALAAVFSETSIGPVDLALSSDDLIACARRLGPFVARLFGVEKAHEKTLERAQEERLVFRFRREFVQKRLRRAPSKVASAADAAWVENLERRFVLPQKDEELTSARAALSVLDLLTEADRRPAPDLNARIALAARATDLLGEPFAADGLRDALLACVGKLEAVHLSRRPKSSWVAYRERAPLESTGLLRLPTHRPLPELPEALELETRSWRGRRGFDLTDARTDTRGAFDEVDACLICHPRNRDSCRTGLKDKEGNFKTTALGVVQSGCPLDERISEAHLLYGDGELVGALATIMVDNPMCPGTGHRICNDCMTSCIFQKQEPIDVPQVETSILSQVLRLPLGFEIYAFLTLFNPLDRRRPFALPANDKKVLVVGMGPAGYTLAHYLSRDGVQVVGIDGLKIEPLDEALTGASAWPPKPIAQIEDIYEPLGDRTLSGFGGVAEYGITVRWDKNFLKIIYLALTRRRHAFAHFGGLRFGGTLGLDDAFALGFDHVAIAAGAGKPTLIPMKNSMARGVRAASDFLMGLQLTGAFKADAIANLQIELPAVVIGGGLTAVDTATELAAYYPVQVSRLLKRVETLGLSAVTEMLDAEERAICFRMLDHARALESLPEPQDPVAVSNLVRAWGGVKVLYRRKMTDSPAYRLNHEEVHKALAEGISFCENLQPLEVVLDIHGHADALWVKRHDDSRLRLPARSVLMAAGTSPNTIYAREMPGVFELDDKARFFAPYKLATGDAFHPLVATHPHDAAGFFTSYVGAKGQLVSYYGDNHPRYAGNVVKAMASSKHGVGHVLKHLAGRAPSREISFSALCTQLKELWTAVVVRVDRLTPTIVEVVVRAPAQAEKFEPGQFFRLQNYEAYANSLGDIQAVMEGIALTGAWVDKTEGTLGMIALEMGASSRLCAQLKPGEPVVVMGPTGSATEIPQGENVVLVGGGLGNAVLFSVAERMRRRGNRVIYFAGYRAKSDLYRQGDVEAHADQVIWSVNGGPLIDARRPQDHSFSGNVVQALLHYAQGFFGEGPFVLKEMDRILTIGSDRMMAAITEARHGILKPYLSAKHQALASINSPMQCMMKEVCAQCLQRHVDPETGRESFVFSCFNQDQPQDHVDWEHLRARLRQNTMLEKVTGAFVTKVMQPTI